MFTVDKVKELGKELPLEESALVEMLSLLENGSCSNFDLCLEVIKVLRNTATKKSSQSFLLRNEKQFVDTFCRILENTILVLNAVSDDEKGGNLNRFFWQFLFNVSVGQELFSIFLWTNESFKGIYFSTLTECKDPQLKDVLFGIAYRCLSQNCKVNIFERNSEDQNVSFIESMLLQILQDSDFALLCIQELCTPKCFGGNSMQFYTSLGQIAKSVLLDVIAEFGTSVGPEILRECSKHFKEKARKILVTTGGPKPSSNELVLEDANETRKLLTCLGILSAFESDQHQTLLQQDRSLLIDSVYLLRMMHELGKAEIPNAWTPARKLADMNNDDFASGDPVFGFKRDLIRLIGNLCHKNKENQDLVRDIDGVQLLLDCSAADGKNPFITQWVVLAIKNLCLGNLDNQNILREMDAKGKVDKKLLAEVGIDLQL